MHRNSQPRLLVLAFLAATVALVVGTAAACGTPEKTVTESRREERSDLTSEQVEKKAAFDRKQQDERTTLTADQAREAITIEMVKNDDQTRFAIDARERLAKLDARVVEMRKLGKKIDVSAVEARDAIQAHIATFDNEPMARVDWSIQRDQVDSELKLLGERLDTIARS